MAHYRRTQRHVLKRIPVEQVTPAHERINVGALVCGLAILAGVIIAVLLAGV